MARQKRIQFPGAFYHIIARGQRRDKIFYNDNDMETFLNYLFEAKEKYSSIVHAYCLMGNHYHLLLETPEGNISDAMHYLNTCYSTWFKKRYNLVGSVFQGRYKAILVDKDEYLLTLSAYIHLNPCRANLVEIPDKYKWSSYVCYTEKKVSKLVSTADIITISGTREAYLQFVDNFTGKTIEIKDIYGHNSVLGSKAFKISVLKKEELAKSSEIREFSDYKNLLKVDSAIIINTMTGIFSVTKAEIFSKKRGNIYRKIYIYAMKRFSPLKLNEIGEILNMDYSAVSESNRRFREKMKKDESIMNMVKQLEDRLRNVLS